MKRSFLLYIVLFSLHVHVQAQTPPNISPQPTVAKEDENVLVDNTKNEEVLFIQEDNTKTNIKENSFKNSFSLALQLKDYKKIEKFLDNGANINHIIYDGNTAVNLSSFHKDTNLLIFVAARKGDLSHLNNNGESILYWGGAGRNVEYLMAIKELMSPTAFSELILTISKRKRTPLHAAVLYEADAVVINWLLENGVFLEAKDENGQTALHYAAVMGKWDTLVQLLQKGGNIREVDNSHISVESYILENWDVLSIGKVYPYLTPLGKMRIDDRLQGQNSVIAEKIRKSDW